MNKYVVLLMLLLPTILIAYGSIPFDQFFIDKTMRIDYYHIGDAKEDIITIDRIYEQGIWAGNPRQLLDPFNNGKYYIKVYDVATNQLIYSKGFGTYFGEYQTTDPAIKGKRRTFRETALIPYPKNKIYFVIEKREKHNLMEPIFSETIDPASVSIIREKIRTVDHVYEAMKNGNPHDKVDIAWIAEGYTAEELNVFKKDVDHFIDVMFSVEPFKKNRKRFNIYGVFQASAESGTDEPRQNRFRNTVVNSSFNALNLERYLLTEDTKSLHDIASSVPYDAVVIMVNSDRYGGGGIYNYYAIATVHNKYADNVFVHEFGHSFGGLADEYYSSNVAYNDFYPAGVEPTEPNITALLDPDHVKWASLLSKGIAVPTVWGKGEYEKLEEERVELRSEKRAKMAELRAEGASDEDVRLVEKEYDRQYKQILDKIEAFQHNQQDLQSKVGVFEGAGYSAKGLYRSQMNCMMFSNSKLQYCKVCESALQRVIFYYCK